MSTAAFLLDAPTTLTETGGQATSRHPIAILGTFKDPRYSTFSVTRRDYVGWVRNMRELQNGRIPVDFDHGPEETGNTEAAGWITKLELAAGKDMDMPGVLPDAEYVVATIEWTDKGADAVKTKRYLFVSPTFQDSFRNEEGDPTGPYLHGVALTNRPFLRRGMPAISLSLGLNDDAMPTPVGSARVSDTPGVPDLKTLRTALKLDDTVSDEDVLAAAVKLAETPPATNPEPAPTDRRTLKQQAEAEGLIVLTAEQREAEQNEMKELKASAARGEAAALILHNKAFDDQLKACRAAGQLDAVEETEKLWREQYDDAPDRTLKLMAALPKVIKTEAKATSGSGAGDAPTGVHTLRYQIDQRAHALMADAEKNGRKLDYSDAAHQAAQELEEANA